jgi:hypothetical protein
LAAHRGGSGIFYFLHILDAPSAFDEDGLPYSRVNLTLVRTYSTAMICSSVNLDRFICQSRPTCRASTHAWFR